MARMEIEHAVQQSLLDRLIDEDPWTSREGGMSRAESVRALKASVRRDLEWLLNTRRAPDAGDVVLEEVRHSLYAYGFPDITSMSRDSASTRAWLIQQVEEAITTFEPRLSGVHVSVVEAKTERRELRLLIEASLRMDPHPEHIVFDTVLELSSGEYQIKESDGA
ncbi:MAG TPA: type VI secretion system baseplate subunit TssE [Gemmatimonadaceae bacterium]|nr:type VI secretion system baseplate subunit TssE [Gemmatimonadaceae bacterium]